MLLHKSLCVMHVHPGHSLSWLQTIVLFAYNFGILQLFPPSYENSTFSVSKILVSLLWVSSKFKILFVSIVPSKPFKHFLMGLKILYVIRHDESYTVCIFHINIESRFFVKETGYSYDKNRLKWLRLKSSRTVLEAFQ